MLQLWVEIAVKARITITLCLFHGITDMKHMLDPSKDVNYIHYILIIKSN